MVDFNFNIDSIDVDLDLTIDGLTIPKFTWAWIGLSFGGLLLEQFAAYHINRFLSRRFGGDPYEQLFEKMLGAFGQMLDDALTRDAVREMSALLNATTTTFKEYLNAPASIDRLEFATNDSAKLISELEQFGNRTYQTYMQAASLRLLILQQRASLDKNEVKNFKEARDRYIAHHKEIASSIKPVVQDFMDKLINQAQMALITGHISHTYAPQQYLWGIAYIPYGPDGSHIFVDNHVNQHKIAIGFGPNYKGEKVPNGARRIYSDLIGRKEELINEIVEQADGGDILYGEKMIEVWKMGPQTKELAKGK